MRCWSKQRGLGFAAYRAQSFIGVETSLSSQLSFVVSTALCAMSLYLNVFLIHCIVYAVLFTQAVLWNDKTWKRWGKNTFLPWNVTWQRSGFFFYAKIGKLSIRDIDVWHLNENARRLPNTWKSLFTVCGFVFFVFEEMCLMAPKCLCCWHH